MLWIAGPERVVSNSAQPWRTSSSWGSSSCPHLYLVCQRHPILLPQNVQHKHTELPNVSRHWTMPIISPWMNSTELVSLQEVTWPVRTPWFEWHRWLQASREQWGGSGVTLHSNIWTEELELQPGWKVSPIVSTASSVNTANLMGRQIRTILWL